MFYLNLHVRFTFELLEHGAMIVFTIYSICLNNEYKIMVCCDLIKTEVGRTLTLCLCC